MDEYKSMMEENLRRIKQRQIDADLKSRFEKGEISLSEYVEPRKSRKNENYD